MKKLVLLVVLALGTGQLAQAGVLRFLGKPVVKAARAVWVVLW